MSVCFFYSTNQWRKSRWQRRRRQQQQRQQQNNTTSYSNMETLKDFKVQDTLFLLLLLFYDCSVCWRFSMTHFRKVVAAVAWKHFFKSNGDEVLVGSCLSNSNTKQITFHWWYLKELWSRCLQTLIKILTKIMAKKYLVISNGKPLQK